MDFFHSLPFIQRPQPSVATIGNFDGMHLGHQALLQKLMHTAQEKNLNSMVILFEPQPLEFLRPDQSPARLQTLSDKLIFLKKIGIDQVCVLRFDQNFAALSAPHFIEQWLIDQLAVSTLLVGEDFRFGQNRSGTVQLLKNYAAQGLLDIIVLPLMQHNTLRISSTEIRHQLHVGNFDQARQLLGRPFSMTGRVIHGAKMGRLLDFPTINIAPHRKKSPLQGVYAVRVKTAAHHPILSGIANLGVRPTVAQSLQRLLEVFLFTEESLDLYTQRVEVEFLIKVRDEQRFDSFSALRTQIEQDVAWVQAYFAHTPF